MAHYDPVDALPEVLTRMEPIARPPTLYTINGIGTSIYGNRDYDRATDTYVKTTFATFVFLPLAGLSSYRVADAPEGGWYFLGKVPLSSRVRSFNVAMLGAALGAVASAIFL